MAVNTTATIENIAISDAGVGLPNECRGAGILNNGTLVVNNATISGCYASSWSFDEGGGGIFNDGTLTVSNSTISGNDGGNPGVGAGIYNYEGTLTVSNCTFSDNIHQYGGGAIGNVNGNITVNNSTFYGNGLGYIPWGMLGKGGAIYSQNGEVAVSNSTFYANGIAFLPWGAAGNLPGEGGAIYCENSVLTVSNSTFYGNEAEEGGAIYSSSSTVTLNNTIVAGNTNLSGGVPNDIDGTISTNSAYNLIGDGAAMSGISNGNAFHNQVGTDSNPINPLLGPLQNNGGPTKTMALLPGSPAIGTGEIVDGITTDQRGYPRPASNPDIGACQGPPPPAAVTTAPLTNESELTWDAVPGASSYQVWRSTTNKQATATEIASGIQSTTYDDATAVPGTTYYYWVKAAKGSQTSTPSAPTTGAANSGPAGVIKLGPLELLDASSNSVQIGFAPASGQSFKPLLTVGGTVTYDNSTITINGTISPDIGSLSFPLFSGSFKIQVGQTAASPGTVKDDDPSSGLQIAGLPIYITGLALKPPVPGVSAAEIEVKGNIFFLNTTVSAAALITDQGLKLESGSIVLPKTSFSVGPLNVKATGMSVEYDSSDDQFIIQGKLTLKDLLQGASVTADLTGDGNGIIVHGTTVNLAGTLSLDDLTLPNGWGLKDATLSVNTLTNTYGGSVTVDTPLFDVGGSIEFLNGHLNDFSLSLTDLATPIPTLIPDLFLTGGSASIANLASTASGPITLSGTLDFACEPDIEVDLPDWLGGNHLSCSIATVVLGGSMSTSDLSGNATVTLADGLATATGTADFNFSTDTFSAKGSIDLADGAFSGTGHITIGNGKVTLAATGTAEIPSSVIGSWLPWHPKVPNVPLASAGLYLNYQQSLPKAQDYLEVWGSISVPYVIGTLTIASPVVRVGFDASVSFPSSKDLPKVDPPASATFFVASGTPWALLGASWPNSTADVPFEVESPDGTIYTEFNLPENIGVIDEADNSTQLAVGVQNPTAGNWTLTLLDASDLGNVTFQSVGGTVVAQRSPNLPPIAR